MVYGRCPVCGGGFVYSVINGKVQRTCAKPKCILTYEKMFVSALLKFKEKLESQDKEAIIEEVLTLARKFFPEFIIKNF